MSTELFSQHAHELFRQAVFLLARLRLASIKSGAHLLACIRILPSHDLDSYQLT